MTCTATLKRAHVVATVATINEGRALMHLVARATLYLLHLCGIGVRVVGVDVLVTYHIIRGQLDNLLVTRVLICHMTVETELILNLQVWHTRPRHSPHVRFRQRLKVTMAIQTFQTFLGVGIRQQVRSLQRLHLRVQVAESTVRIGAPRSHFRVADLAPHIQIALLVAVQTGRHRNSHSARNETIPVPHGSMAIAAGEVLRRTVNNLVVRRAQVIIWILIRQLAVA
jgi:hypothetical protein